MPEGFDPYYKWLGIPPQDQPPHHYRLLAIPLFEADPDVIECAADQRMGHVRTFQTGRYAAYSQQILNELAAARICLLSREKKLAYDTQLKAQLAPSPPLPPPTQPTPATILPSPPPPIKSTPHLAPTPPQSETASSPPESPPGQPSSFFPPLDPTLPDPAPPSVMATRTAASRSRNASLITTAVGVTLLVFAGLAFWILYSDQMQHDAVSTPVSAGPSSRSPLEPDAPLPGAGNENEPADRQSEKTSTAIASRNANTRPPSDATNREESPTAEPAEPEIDPPPPSTDLAREAARRTRPRNRSLADLLKQAEQSNEMSTPTSTEEEETGNSNQEQEKEPEKSRVPRPAARSRAAVPLQPLLAQGNFNTLLIEAQQPNRNPTETYILLTAAHDKAFAALDGAGVLQAIDLIESKFLGDFDAQRVESLRLITIRLTQQRKTQQGRDLADVALQASQRAQQEGNKARAKDFANIALDAARLTQDPVLQKRISDHLNQF